MCFFIILQLEYFPCVNVIQFIINFRIFFFDTVKETVKKNFNKELGTLLKHLVPDGTLVDDHIR